MQYALGEKEFQRIADELKLYERYYGIRDVWSESEPPTDIDYTPTSLSINYLRKMIDTIAAWQFEREPKVGAPPTIIDDPVLTQTLNAEPSDGQQAENRHAKAKEALLTKVWRDNRMHEKLLAAAKDRAISKTGVFARLHYDRRRGGIRVLFHPSTEVIPVYNEWDIDQLDEVHFTAYLDEDQTKLWKLSYYLVWQGDGETDAGYYECEIEEAIYDEELNVIEERVERSPMGLDFIPAVHIPTDKLTGVSEGTSELEKMIEVADEINKKLSDYSDALRFEMFAITLLKNVDEDPKNPLRVSPSAVWNLGDGDKEVGEPHAERLESGFRFKEAIETYLDRMYKALHELSEVPVVNTSELKTGGINEVAMQLMFSSIISKTQRSWVIWQSRLQTLNEYILRYMQARQDHVNFKYDVDLLAEVGDEYSNEITFNLPLPKDQVALVEQLSTEIASNLESIKGAIRRSGKENAEAKLLEILSEQELMRDRRTQNEDPYSREEQPQEV